MKPRSTEKWVPTTRASASSAGSAADLSPASPGGGSPSWADELPQRAGNEVETRQRAAPVLDRLRAAAPRIAECLPECVAPWWPYVDEGRLAVRLAVSEPECSEREVDLALPAIRIGRGESAQVRLAHAAVSTDHAELLVEHGAVTVADLKSRNGTRKNDAPLEPLRRVPLEVGDRLDLGPCTITLRQLRREAVAASSLAVRAEPLAALRQWRPFHLLSAPGDRWVRVQWSGETVWLRVPAAWTRACWRDLGEATVDTAAEPDPLEEGAAQHVLSEIAAAVGERLGTPLTLSGWMTPLEADAVAGDLQHWLHGTAWLLRAPAAIATTVVVPLNDEVSGPSLQVDDTTVPASVELGLIRLTVPEWQEIRAGDALLPDVWMPASWSGEGDRSLGRVLVTTRGFYCEADLRVENGELSIAVERSWIHSAGGGWSMSDKDAESSDATPISVSALELDVTIELERLPVSVGEMQSWRPGHCVKLGRGPNDPVRLVLDGGGHRRVLAEGRVVVVDGKLGVEIVRLVAEIRDDAATPAHAPREASR